MDGSGIHDCFGAGIYGPSHNHSVFSQRDGYPQVYTIPPD